MAGYLEMSLHSIKSLVTLSNKVHELALIFQLISFVNTFVGT